MQRNHKAMEQMTAQHQVVAVSFASDLVLAARLISVGYIQFLRLYAINPHIGSTLYCYCTPSLRSRNSVFLLINDLSSCPSPTLSHPSYDSLQAQQMNPQGPDPETYDGGLARSGNSAYHIIPFHYLHLGGHASISVCPSRSIMTHGVCIIASSLLFHVD